MKVTYFRFHNRILFEKSSIYFYDKLQETKLSWNSNKNNTPSTIKIPDTELGL